MLGSAVLVALALAASPAATRLEEARAAADEFQYDRALKLTEAALKEPDIEHETLAGLYELMGTSAATLGRAARAREAFTLLVLVQPDHQLSRNLPPRVRTPYFEARSLAAKLGPVSLTAAPAEKADGRVVGLTFTVRDVPQLPAATVRVRLKEDDATERLEVVPVPPGRKVHLAASGRRVRWRAELLTERGAVLRVLEREELPPPPPPRPLPPPPAPPPLTAAPPPPPSKAWMRPTGWTLAGVGLAGLGAGGVLGYLSSDARAQLATPTHSGLVVTSLTQVQAAALDARARTFALWANVGFIAGGALAAAGTALVAFGWDAPAPVSLWVGPGGLMVAGTF